MIVDIYEDVIRVYQDGSDADTLATVRGFVRAFDPSADPRGWGEGSAALATTLGDGFRRQGVEPSSIDGIVLSSSGSVDGDRLALARHP